MHSIAASMVHLRLVKAAALQQLVLLNDDLADEQPCQQHQLQPMDHHPAAAATAPSRNFQADMHYATSAATVPAGASTAAAADPMQHAKLRYSAVVATAAKAGCTSFLVHLQQRSASCHTTTASQAAKL